MQVTLTIVLVKEKSCSLASLSWFLATGKCGCVGVSLHHQFCSVFCQIAKQLIDVVAVKSPPPSPACKHIPYEVVSIPV
jgi:hypothetical protein